MGRNAGLLPSILLRPYVGCIVLIFRESPKAYEMSCALIQPDARSASNSVADADADASWPVTIMPSLRTSANRTHDVEGLFYISSACIVDVNECERDT